MKQQQSPQIQSTPNIIITKDGERESDLKVIDRILDRRYEVLVELG